MTSVGVNVDLENAFSTSTTRGAIDAHHQVGGSAVRCQDHGHDLWLYGTDLRPDVPAHRTDGVCAGSAEQPSGRDFWRGLCRTYARVLWRAWVHRGPDRRATL